MLRMSFYAKKITPFLFPIFFITNALCVTVDTSNTNALCVAADRSNTKASSLSSTIDQILAIPAEIHECPLREDQSSTKIIKKKKPWTFITYMAADNDLAPFARKNLKQQADVGSNEHINIVTQLDTKVAGNKKVTKRYYIERNKLILTNENDPSSQKMDSGSPNTLIACCKWAIENYPAEHYALNFWNHGTGELNVGPRRTNINPWPLFSFNPNNNLIELDRSIPFLDFVETMVLQDRGICFDDSTGHYLNDQDLDMALNHICTNLLQGKKIDLLCFDACLMSMIGVTNITKKYAHYMVASQEVELGTGHDYQKTLSPFLQKSLDPKTFAIHIVAMYEETYNKITNDFTQSALDLSQISALEKNINDVALLLIESLKAQKGSTVTEAIKASRHKLFCTHFDEPSYLDIHHLYVNLLANLKRFTMNSIDTEKSLHRALKQNLSEGLNLIAKVVIANRVGQNLSNARGISLYFPEHRIHSSYSKTSFAQSNQWFSFLKVYLAYANKGTRQEAL